MKSQKRKLIFIRSVFLSLLAVLLMFSPKTFALTDEQLNFFAENGIYYYNPDGSRQCTIGTGSYNGSASAGLSALQSAFVDTYHDIAQQLSVEFGIPWETVMAQGILESAAGTSRFAVERNNFFGIGAFDSNPDNAFSYDTPEAGWRGYYENIAKTATYRNHGVFRADSTYGNTITDPYAYLAAIKAAGYATDPNYINKVSTIIAAVENRASEQSWLSSAKLAETYPEMLTNAASNAAGTTSPASSTQNYTSFTCVSSGSGGTRGNGSINETAIALSWSDRVRDRLTPNELYRTALSVTGVNRLGDECSMAGNSCDAFVVTVLRYSGVDTNIPCCGSANIFSYFKNHPELYEEIPNIGNSSNMMPGDIRSSNSHVEIYVQLSDGSYRIASASHCERTADHGVGYYVDSSYKIFRRKQ